MTDPRQEPAGSWNYSLLETDEPGHDHLLAIPLHPIERVPLTQDVGEVQLCPSHVRGLAIIASARNTADEDCKSGTAMLVARTDDGFMHYLDYINDVPVFTDIVLN